jgi:hypothetical protein
VCTATQPPFCLLLIQGSCRWPTATCGSQLRAFAQHHLRDGDRVAAICLAGPVPTALAMRAPSRDVKHLVPCRLKRGDKEPVVAGRALDADDRLASILGDQPVAKLPHPLGAVDEAERAELAAPLVQQRGDVRASIVGRAMRPARFERATSASAGQRSIP